MRKSVFLPNGNNKSTFQLEGDAPAAFPLKRSYIKNEEKLSKERGTLKMMQIRFFFLLLIMLVCDPNLFAQHFENKISTTICVTKIEKQQKYYIITALDGDEYVVVVSKHHKKTESSVKLRPNRCYTMCLIPYLKDNIVPTEGLRYTIRIDGDDVLVPLRGRNIYFVSNLFGLYLTP